MVSNRLPKEVEDAIRVLRDYQSFAPYDHYRTDLWEKIMKDYCPHCGGHMPEPTRCYCTCDD